MNALKLGALVFGVALPSAALADTDVGARVAARSHYFGFENVDQENCRVDPDKVVISWFSVQSYAVAAKGRVFLMDSHIFRLSDTPGYVPTTLQELVDLDPEAIFIGHGHGDHADNAAYIAVQTGARIFGAAEHCDAMQGDAERIFGPGTEVKCTALTTPASIPGDEVREIGFLRPDLCITSFKHLHSGEAPLDPDFPPNPINPVQDPRVDELYPPQPEPTLDTTTESGEGGFVSMFYQFAISGSSFSFIWHDTNGPIKEFEPQLIDLLLSLPKADVEIGSLVSIGETVNGVRDIAIYIENIKPKIFYGATPTTSTSGRRPTTTRRCSGSSRSSGSPRRSARRSAGSMTRTTTCGTGWRRSSGGTGYGARSRTASPAIGARRVDSSSAGEGGPGAGPQGISLRARPPRAGCPVR
jgi:hypothetical protein